ncbi:substrate-binding domain-containing protein [Phycicoccus flavus]|uniref:substrate-binding domain-containing protein n=1 Tax=Phycicoccus flavus TaxID=2502783 RepID=UPI000FEBBC0F|nr:substrate-binding domain-containing protein [Phycicoccus flavus]NHA68244.1 substrate-binding domain-containing protein [Phycicoccus flavus]
MTNIAFSRRGHSRTIATCLGVAALVAVAGCSTEQEGSAPQASAEDCLNADEAQAAYQSSWSSVAEAFELEDFQPTDEQVCQVDTATWKAEPKQGDSYRVAFAAQGPTNSWGVLSDEALRYHADELGVDVLYAAANGDATTQVDNIQQLASQNPDAMVVVPMGDGISGQVKAAVDQGIPVVLCSGVLPSSSGAVSTVTRQYDLLGSAYAEWIAKKLDGKGKVAILSGLAGVPTAEYQKAAAETTFEKYPDIEVVTTQYTEWSPTVAKTVAQNLIASYPDLDAIWSDSGYGALGVAQAYEEAGKPVPPITGDAINDFILATDGKDVQYALSTFPPEMSSTCLDTALGLVKGEPVLDKVYIDSPSFTDADGATYARKDCDGGLLVPSSAPEPLLTELKMCKA